MNHIVTDNGNIIPMSSVIYMSEKDRVVTLHLIGNKTTQICNKTMSQLLMLNVPADLTPVIETILQKMDSMEDMITARAANIHDVTQIALHSLKESNNKLTKAANSVNRSKGELFTASGKLREIVQELERSVGVE